ncbi:hypothetical protein Q8F55_006032 [Vanrija albida]|uniref:DUF659 domain-containing protein n=1 Tax=Vanrija albida TaxID=181172 RepID=A0ABR3Q417_9TREE
MSTVFSSMTPQQQLQNREVSGLLCVMFPLYRKLVVETLATQSVGLAKEYKELAKKSMPDDRSPPSITPEANRLVDAIMEWNHAGPASRATIPNLFKLKHLKKEMKDIMAQLEKSNEEEDTSGTQAKSSRLGARNSIIGIVISESRSSRWIEWREIVYMAYGLLTPQHEWIAADGFDRHLVMHELFKRIDEEWRKNMSFRRFFAIVKTFPTGLVAHPINIVIDVVEQMCKEGLLDVSKLFPIDSNVNPRTHAQVRRDCSNFLRNHMDFEMFTINMLPKEEQDASMTKLMGRPVTWHLQRDFRSWRIAQNLPNQLIPSSDANSVCSL